MGIINLSKPPKKISPPQIAKFRQNNVNVIGIKTNEGKNDSIKRREEYPLTITLFYKFLGLFGNALFSTLVR